MPTPQRDDRTSHRPRADLRTRSPLPTGTVSNEPTGVRTLALALGRRRRLGSLAHAFSWEQKLPSAGDGRLCRDHNCRGPRARSADGSSAAEGAVAAVLADRPECAVEQALAEARPRRGAGFLRLERDRAAGVIAAIGLTFRAVRGRRLQRRRQDHPRWRRPAIANRESARQRSAGGARASAWERSRRSFTRDRSPPGRRDGGRACCLQERGKRVDESDSLAPICRAVACGANHRRGAPLRGRCF